ncbi:hypothetical protein FRB96_003181 [Tulasnella sp. 330]|nr:hypothetical protein FRB96_003181 [Tulasnella sp. 330]KAG8884312.1 hypothetical protein FRB97_004576 [Tulasnella sp. 331]KAG8886714.1 hypothetical protein FRB98_001066 [Tulasnella sp. 332]
MLRGQKPISNPTTSADVDYNTSTAAHNYPPPSAAASASTSTASIAEQRQHNMQLISEIRDESESWWAWAAAAWLATLAFPLLLFPRLLLFLSTPARAVVGVTAPRETLTTLESFLCTHAGIGLLALSIALIISIPDAPPISRTVAPEPLKAHPLLGPLSVSLSITAFVSYNTSRIGALSIIMAIGCGFTGLWGLWVGTGNYSNKTGADKHTSSFFFGNRASASKQKQLWKKEVEREIELQQMGNKS